MVANSSLAFDDEVVGPMVKPSFVDHAGLKFRIASMRSNIGVDVEYLSPRSATYTFKDRASPGLLKIRNPKLIPQLISKRASELAGALSHDPNMVVFPEFALPPVVHAKKSIPARRLFTRRFQQMVEKKHEGVAAEILRQAKAKTGSDRTPFIFYGSAHCSVCRLNIGVVSVGDPIERGFGRIFERGKPDSPHVEPTPDDPIRHSGPIAHRKRYPARRAGEAARVPDDGYFRLYLSELGYICVLICSDSIDANQALYIVHKNNLRDSQGGRGRIFLVIVPSYTRSNIMLDSHCRDLSFEARTIVLVTNALGMYRKRPKPAAPERFPESRIYFNGMDEIALEEAQIVEKTHKRMIDLYDLDLGKQMLEVKKSWEVYKKSNGSAGP